MAELRIQRFTGAALEQYIPALAQLRIDIFRDFPYLYDGSVDYEKRYLDTYRRCPESVVVVAFDGDEVVGASTGIPMAFEESSFQQPFIDEGYAPDRIFYLAESVLRAPYRGQGLGVRFFAEREAHARALGGFEHFTFCAVQRSEAHPLRPVSYRPLNSFWQKRGYVEQAKLKAVYRWKDVDENNETLKTMVFWVKSLA